MAGCLAGTRTTGTDRIALDAAGGKVVHGAFEDDAAVVGRMRVRTGPKPDGTLNRKPSGAFFFMSSNTMRVAGVATVLGAYPGPPP